MRERDHALVDDVERDHVAGLGEGRGRGLGVAVAHLGGDVAGGLVADQRRAFGDRAVEVDHHRQLFVVDHHGFGRVARLLQRLGDHERHRLADEAHALVRQHAARRRGAGAPSAA